MKQDSYPTKAFATRSAFHAWLAKNHATSDGLWLRIARKDRGARKDSGAKTVSWEDAVDEGLIYGWSEGQRRKGDDETYLQLFTPRRKIGTTSSRAQGRVKALLKAGRITKAGKAALGLD